MLLNSTSLSIKIKYYFNCSVYSIEACDWLGFSDVISVYGCHGYNLSLLPALLQLLAILNTFLLAKFVLQ